MIRLNLTLYFLILIFLVNQARTQTWDPGWYSKFEQVVRLDSAHYLIIGDNSRQARTAKYIARIKKSSTGYELQETTFIYDTILNLSLVDSSLIVLQKLRQGCDYYPNDHFLTVYNAYDFSKDTFKPLYSLPGNEATLVNDSLILMFDGLLGTARFYDTSLSAIDSIQNPVYKPLFFHEDDNHRFILMQGEFDFFLMVNRQMFNFNWQSGIYTDFLRIPSWSPPSLIKKVRFFTPDSIAIFTRDSLYLTDTNMGAPVTYALPSYDEIQILEEEFFAFSSASISKYRLANLSRTWLGQVNTSLPRTNIGYMDAGSADSTIVTYSSDYNYHCEIGAYDLRDPGLNEVVDLRIDSLNYLSTKPGPGGFENQSSFDLSITNVGNDSVFYARLSHEVYSQYNYCQREVESSLSLMLAPGEDTSISIGINHYYPNTIICVFLSAANNALELTPGNNSGCHHLKLSYAELRFNKLNCYPNPVHSGILHIEGLEQKTRELSIYDVSGIRVMSLITSGQNSLDIDISNLKSGVYFLNFISEDGSSIVEKIIIQ